MKSDKKVKRNTKLIILSVLVLTIISLSYSYSAFFSIDSRASVHAISTGTLDVTAEVTAMTNTEVFPTEEILPTSPDSSLINEDKDCATLIVYNNSNIDANFIVSISYDKDNIPPESADVGLVSFDNLFVGIYDIDNTSWLNLNPDATKAPIYNMKITQFANSESDVYPIFKGSIDKATISETGTESTTRNLRVYVWLADNTPTSEIGKLMYLKLNVQSMPAKGQNEGQIQIQDQSEVEG